MAFRLILRIGKILQRAEIFAVCDLLVNGPVQIAEDKKAIRFESGSQGLERLVRQWLPEVDTTDFRTYPRGAGGNSDLRHEQVPCFGFKITGSASHRQRARRCFEAQPVTGSGLL